MLPRLRLLIKPFHFHLNSQNDTKAKQLVPLKTTRTPLERYESGRWILFTAFTVLGVIIFLLGMAGIASIGNSPAVVLRVAEDNVKDDQASQGQEELNQTSLTGRKYSEADTGGKRENYTDIEQKPEL